ncbi:MAG TPA: hypothetical protein VHP34_11195 [Alphaproteobacteria bacterium]|nr:hypothetical protein [Alphaproteobacteria bacterium]
MNSFAIAELFIHAAYVDTRLPINARPAKEKSAWVPFVHSDEDIKSRIRTGERKEKLMDGDDPFNDWLKEYWDDEKQKLSRQDVKDWETCNELIKLVSNESNRRCLWAWAHSKVDGLKIHIDGKGTQKASFAKWCRHVEGIHEMTGSRRKDRAILSIEASFVRKGLQNNDNAVLGLLPTGGEIEHISDKMAAALPRQNKRAWMADGAFSSPILPDGEYNFDWAESRNEARRQKHAAAQRKQAA